MKTRGLTLTIALTLTLTLSLTLTPGLPDEDARPLRHRGGGAHEAKVGRHPNPEPRDR